MVRTTTTKIRILCITHEQDVDGLFCGAILKNAFPDTLVFLTNYGHENIKRIADVIRFNVNRSSKSGTIVISDLALNNNNLEDVKSIEEKRMEFSLVRPSLLARRNKKKSTIICYSYLIRRPGTKLCF